MCDISKGERPGAPCPLGAPLPLTSTPLPGPAEPPAAPNQGLRSRVALRPHHSQDSKRTREVIDRFWSIVNVKALAGAILLGVGVLVFTVLWIGVLNIARYAVSTGHLYSEVTLVYGGAALLEPIAIVIAVFSREGSAGPSRPAVLHRVTKVIWACNALSYVLLGYVVLSGGLW